MTGEHIPQNTGMETMPEGPAEPQPSQNAPAAEPEFPLGPRDSAWRLLGVYIIYQICTGLLMIYEAGPVFDAGYSQAFIATIMNIQSVLVTLLLYRIFFGPLMPRIREVWGHAWVPLSDGVKITGVVLFFFLALRSFGRGYSGSQDLYIWESLIALAVVAPGLLIGYGTLFRLFLRFSMPFTLLAAVLVTFLSSGLMMEVYIGHHMFTYSYTIVNLINSIGAVTWGMYIYKRFNTLTPIFLLEIGRELIQMAGKLCH